MFRRIAPFVAVWLVLAAFAESAESKPAKKPEPLTVKDSFSIDTPDGFAWSEVKKVEAGGFKATVYLCAKEGDASRLVLTAQERTSEGDAGRIATLKANYNVLITTLKGAGFTEVKGEKVTLTPPIADKVKFVVSAKDPQGNAVVFATTTVFGKNTYSLQAQAASQDQVDALSKVAESLSEPKVEK